MIVAMFLNLKKKKDIPVNAKKKIKERTLYVLYKVILVISRVGEMVVLNSYSDMKINSLRMNYRRGARHPHFFLLYSV